MIFLPSTLLHTWRRITMQSLLSSTASLPAAETRMAGHSHRIRDTTPIRVHLPPLLTTPPHPLSHHPTPTHARHASNQTEAATRAVGSRLCRRRRGGRCCQTHTTWSLRTTPAAARRWRTWHRCCRQFARRTRTRRRPSPCPTCRAWWSSRQQRVRAWPPVICSRSNGTLQGVARLLCVPYRRW